MMITLLSIKGIKKPIELDFQSEEQYMKFWKKLLDNEVSIVSVGPITFAKSEFKYLVYKNK